MNEDYISNQIAVYKNSKTLIVSRVSSYIDSWEKAVAPSLIKLAKNTMESRRADKAAA